MATIKIKLLHAMQHMFSLFTHPQMRLAMLQSSSKNYSPSHTSYPTGIGQSIPCSARELVLHFHRIGPSHACNSLSVWIPISNTLSRHRISGFKAIFCTATFVKRSLPSHRWMFDLQGVKNSLGLNFPVQMIRRRKNTYQKVKHQKLAQGYWSPVSGSSPPTPVNSSTPI